MMWVWVAAVFLFLGFDSWRLILWGRFGKIAFGTGTLIWKFNDSDGVDQASTNRSKKPHTFGWHGWCSACSSGTRLPNVRLTLQPGGHPWGFCGFFLGKLPRSKFWWTMKMDHELSIDYQDVWGLWDLKKKTRMAIFFQPMQWWVLLEVHSSLKNFFLDASMVPVLFSCNTIDSITESPEFTFDKTQKEGNWDV